VFGCCPGREIGPKTANGCWLLLSFFGKVDFWPGQVNQFITRLEQYLVKTCSLTGQYQLKKRMVEFIHYTINHCCPAKIINDGLKPLPYMAVTNPGINAGVS
jgi:hypothetical protein